MFTSCPRCASIARIRPPLIQTASPGFSPFVVPRYNARMARRFQFSLTTLFLGTLLAAGLSAAWIYLPHVVFLFWLIPAVFVLAVLTQDAISTIAKNRSSRAKPQPAVADPKADESSVPG